MIQTLFFKTVNEFATEYHLNKGWVETYILHQVKDKRQPIVVGMTELNLLCSLGMVDKVGDIDPADDPRNQVYILHID